MKRIFLSIIAMLSVLFSAFTLEARQVTVRGYYRKNGTYVAPHVRNVGGNSRSSSTYYPKEKTSYAKPKVKDSSSSYKAYTPNSYKVFQQRQTQGSRTFSKGMKQRKYQEQGGVCPHCLKHCSYEEMEGDHVVPYSKGGATEYSNLQMLCQPCNRSKGNKYSY